MSINKYFTTWSRLYGSIMLFNVYFWLLLNIISNSINVHFGQRTTIDHVETFSELLFSDWLSIQVFFYKDSNFCPLFMNRINFIHMKIETMKLFERNQARPDSLGKIWVHPHRHVGRSHSVWVL